MLHVLCIGAHPDDIEVSIGGTASLYRKRGDEVKIVSVTDGSKGHFDKKYLLDPESLVIRRQHEARGAATSIGAVYESLGIPDGEVYVTQANTEAMVRLIRSSGTLGFGPDLVLLNRPTDYHRDHRYTAQLVLDASYMLTVPPMCSDTLHCARMPVFAYWQDDFTEGGPFRADVVVPIDEVMDTKIDLICHHESQFFEWLPFNNRWEGRFPESQEGRREVWSSFYRARAEECWSKYGDTIVHITGSERGARYAEAFQISEYGRQPGEDELAKLFPI